MEHHSDPLVASPAVCCLEPRVQRLAGLASCVGLDAFYLEVLTRGPCEEGPHISALSPTHVLGRQARDYRTVLAAVLALLLAELPVI